MQELITLLSQVGDDPEARRDLAKQIVAAGVDTSALDKAYRQVIADKPIWEPQEGPQSKAYYSEADILLYGGQAGGGKTDLLIGCAMTAHHRSALFRNEIPQGIIDRIAAVDSENMRQGGQARWKVPGREATFHHLEKPGAESKHQGVPRDFLGFDEAAQIDPKKILFVMGWNRVTEGAPEGQKVRAILASNPPEDARGEYLIDWFGPWLDASHPLYGVEPGELLWAVFEKEGDQNVTKWCPAPGYYKIVNGQPIFVAPQDADEDWVKEHPEWKLAKSRTFIPASLSDNKYLDASYAAQIDQMEEPFRTALKTGNFMLARVDDLRQIIPSKWIDAAMARWNGPPSRGMIHMGVDIAQGGSDFTTLAPLHEGDHFGELHKYPGKQTPDGAEVVIRVLEHLRNTAGITIDCGGGYGGATTQYLDINHQDITYYKFNAADGSGVPLLKFGGRRFAANQRSEMWFRFAEALDPSSEYNIVLPPDQSLRAQLVAPTWKMQGAEKVLVESKDDLKKRLNRSTDDADAVLMAWFNRGRTIVKRKQERSNETADKQWNDYDPHGDV